MASTPTPQTAAFAYYLSAHRKRQRRTFEGGQIDEDDSVGVLKGRNTN